MFATSSPARLRGLGLIALAAVSWGTTGSVTALLVGGVPMFVIAALIKLTSPGPVFYRQERCGLNGPGVSELPKRRPSWPFTSKLPATGRVH